MTAQAGAHPPEKGVSELLARDRAGSLSSVRYDLALTIPAASNEPVLGRVVITFVLRAPRVVELDFAAPANHVREVRVDQRMAPYTLVNNHLVIPSEWTRAGENVIQVEFVAGDDPLNRDPEFLYSLFVPARAHRAFPCFDQPDLKARYTLTLDVPAEWEAVANAATVSTETTGARTRVRFAETQPISTYLFAFAAGRFTVETAERNGRQYRMFHRETDAGKVARNRDAIFDLHASALRWLEDYTDIPYPFGKFDIVAIPAFQFSGMEHPGTILYNGASLFLDPSATQNQMLDRASLIAHETSHMWFGDLVTMRWFNDVWMKEVFANFIAAKIVDPAFPQVNHPLRFLLAHYPGAYQVDRSSGANPIRQDLANLEDAGQMYGPIIYQKAPIVMRQLEMIVGERRFRDGVREYLKSFAFGNATWLDLIRILDSRTSEDLASWSHAWVEQRGRPEFQISIEGDGRHVSRLILEMRDPLERGLAWPQQLRIALGYRGRVQEIPVYVTGGSTRVREAEGKTVPLFVLPNGGGLGYGLFVLDDASRDYLLGSIEAVADATTRGSAWITLWDNLVEGRVQPVDLLDTMIRALPAERDEQNVQRILAYATRTFWRYLSTDQRLRAAPLLEAIFRTGVERAATSSSKAAWFSAFRDIALTPSGLEWLRSLWAREQKIAGLIFAETDEITMAQELAVREVPGWRDILATQRDRIQNPDRKARFEFVMPALSADPPVREAMFERLRHVENRRREPWVGEALAYLNHPLRAAHAIRFVRPGLEMLREIQQTGDIFFPARWTESILGGHRSPEAASEVRNFLGRELQYPQRLRWTVLIAADELLRLNATAPSVTDSLARER